MSIERLLRAIGTLHCPSCEMPLFANVLDAGDTGGAIDASASRFIAPFIMAIDDAFPEAASVIDTAEALALWCPSAVVGDGRTGYESNRTNDFLMVTSQLDAGLGALEAAFRRLFHDAARHYARAVGHLRLRGELG